MGYYNASHRDSVYHNHCLLIASAITRCNTHPRPVHCVLPSLLERSPCETYHIHRQYIMDLYYNAGSVPCRGVLHTINALGLKVNMKVIDLLDKQHLTPEFLAINPQHTIPTLVDGDFKLWERSVIKYIYV